MGTGNIDISNILRMLGRLRNDCSCLGKVSVWSNGRKIDFHTETVTVGRDCAQANCLV